MQIMASFHSELRHTNGRDIFEIIMEGTLCACIADVVAHMTHDPKGLAALRASSVALRMACDDSERYWLSCIEARSHWNIGFLPWVKNAPGGFTHREWFAMMVKALPEITVAVFHQGKQTRHVELSYKPACQAEDSWWFAVNFREPQLIEGKVVRAVSVNVLTADVVCNGTLIPSIQFGRFL